MLQNRGPEAMYGLRARGAPVFISGREAQDQKRGRGDEENHGRSLQEAGDDVPPHQRAPAAGPRPKLSVVGGPVAARRRRRALARSLDPPLVGLPVELRTDQRRLGQPLDPLGKDMEPVPVHHVEERDFLGHDLLEFTVDLFALRGVDLP